MKIGTLTFHWATNFGAILQAYALQQWIRKQGIETEIIDYVPWKNVLGQRYNWIRKLKISNFIKELKLKRFRKKYLVRSKKFPSSEKLKKCRDSYDMVICGSDQIWNMSFTFNGEFKNTLSYFADFAGENTKRLAYAVSFGTDKVSDDYISLTKTEVSKFSSISVREQTGLDVVKQLGSSARVVCDPTLLLPKNDYDRLIGEGSESGQKIFSYVLRDNKETIETVKLVQKIFECNDEIDTKSNYGLIEWLKKIKYSEIVVTNSYHGVVLSLIFNTPFVAVLPPESGMNDRLVTILTEVGLSDRIVQSPDYEAIKKICGSKIDWTAVNASIEGIRQDSETYLSEHIRRV
ncbi:MAG: polysaccharide pyruvyl transferase family protein [Oscillospiraceae bacterium]|nr:polysaccharide pyruvyl transferase family protein [Oscillospiraceae bacterium]